MFDPNTKAQQQSERPVISKITVKCQLVSRYFEPSQPQRIVSGLNTNFKFSLSPSDNAHKSSHHKFSTVYKISPNKNVCNTMHTVIYTNIKHKVFEKLVLSVLPLFKKHMRPGTPVSWTVASIYQYHFYQIFKKYVKKK